MAKVKPPAKPTNFQEFQTAAKGILDAEGVNYYEWLHDMHMKVVHDVISKTPEKLASLVSPSKPEEIKPPVETKNEPANREREIVNRGV